LKGAKPIPVRTSSRGVVIYEMITGRKAFENKSQASLISAIMSSEPPPLASLQPMTPKALDRLVKNCIARDPELEDDTRQALGLLEPIHRGDVGMVERREEFRYALEARQPIRILRERLRQDLDRDVALQPRIARAVDLTHSARPDERDHFVDSETNAWREGHATRAS